MIAAGLRFDEALLAAFMGPETRAANPTAPESSQATIAG
jgi:hypothetical protein